jgi:MFS family permease
MFAVGWGANQFSPMLLAYRAELGLTPGPLAGLFAIYAAALIPGLLIGGPASDRFGRRPVVLPFVILSPAATVALMAGAHSLPLIAAGRALAGLCSGVVFGAATAWVRELSPDAGAGARRAAVALTAGFGLGPLAAAVLAQWAPDPLVLPYLPHVLIGVAAVAVAWPAPESVTGQAAGRRRWPPAGVRTLRFWLGVAPAAPWVFGCAALAFVILPEQITGIGGLAIAFAGMTGALALAVGVGVQPLARRLAARWRLAGNVAGLGCAAAGALLTVPVLATGSIALGGLCAVLFGLGYGLCLVTGLRESERLAGPSDQGAVVACYYVLTYLGFGFPYLANGLDVLTGKDGAYVVLAVIAAVTAAWTAAYGARSRPAGEHPAREHPAAGRQAGGQGATALPAGPAGQS